MDVNNAKYAGFDILWLFEYKITNIPIGICNMFDPITNQLCHNDDDNSIEDRFMFSIGIRNILLFNKYNVG